MVLVTIFFVIALIPAKDRIRQHKEEVHLPKDKSQWNGRGAVTVIDPLDLDPILAVVSKAVPLPELLLLMTQI